MVRTQVYFSEEQHRALRQAARREGISMTALLRYGTGMPFHRLEGLQKNFGIPLAASTQWDIVLRPVKKVLPAYQALFFEAAQGDVIYVDDTPVKILELMKKRKEGKGDDG